jgi:predicted TPR repeat methyltransferase
MNEIAAAATIDTDARPIELSIADALAFAVQLHRAGELNEAEIIYTRILELAPDYADALHFLGILRLYRGREDEAIALVSRSIELNPAQADWHSNLGNVLLAAQRRSESIEAYKRAVAIDPTHAAALTNLGAVLALEGRREEAAVAYQQAMKANPEFAEAYNNYGNLLTGMGQIREGLEYYCKALTFRRNDPHTRMLVGLAHTRLGHVEEAAEVFRDWLRDQPDHPIARHLLAACSGVDIPERASDAYVEKSFDDFADTFDARLSILEYRAPNLIADALRRACGEPKQALVALDAGCGTGLCGLLIASHCSRLVGVDLSQRMLYKAHGRGVYDELVKSELTEFLEQHASAFDVVLSADTLVYFGALEAVCCAASGALKAAGVLLFTLEAASDEEAPSGFKLNPHGRYSHTSGYVRRTLAACGFGDVATERAVLRMEAGSPVAGWVVTARKPENQSARAR